MRNGISGSKMADRKNYSSGRLGINLFCFPYMANAKTALSIRDECQNVLRHRTTLLFNTQKCDTMTREIKTMQVLRWDHKLVGSI